MLQAIVAVRDTAHGKFWVDFDCGHTVLCDKQHRREFVYPSLTWDCPFCMTFNDLQPGDEVELYYSYDREFPTIAKFMGIMLDGRLRFILPDGQDDFPTKREIVRYKKL